MFSLSHSFNSSLVARLGIRSASSSGESGVFPSPLVTRAIWLGGLENAFCVLFYFFVHSTYSLVFQRHGVLDGSNGLCRLRSCSLLNKCLNTSDLGDKCVHQFAAKSVSSLTQLP